MSMRTTMTNILPHDVVVDILARLPVKSLLRFRCVSKPWNSFFKDPSFIKMHLNHSFNNYQHLLLTSPSNNLYYIADNDTTESSLADEIVEIDYPLKTPTTSVGILDSCNGLLLIMHCNIFCIWNPSTKEFKKVPHTPIEYPKNYLDRCRDIVYGFGYDKILDDYKVVRIVRFDDLSSEVKVYTLGSNSWRRIQDIPDYLTLTCATQGKFANGALHWVACRVDSYYDTNDEDLEYIILSLNIEDEKYEEIQQPNYADHVKYRLDVEVLGGCLCIVWYYKVLDILYHEILVMKDYGVKESWTKLFPTAQTNIGYVKPIKVTKNGEIFLAKDLNALSVYDPKRGTEKQVLEVKDEDTLLVYDPKCGTTKSLEIDGMHIWFDIYTYVESLISLNSGTCCGERTRHGK